MAVSLLYWRSAGWLLFTACGKSLTQQNFWCAAMRGSVHLHHVFCLPKFFQTTSSFVSWGMLNSPNLTLIETFYVVVQGVADGDQDIAVPVLLHFCQLSLLCHLLWPQVLLLCLPRPQLCFPSCPLVCKSPPPWLASASVTAVGPIPAHCTWCNIPMIQAYYQALQISVFLGMCI